MRSSSRHSAPGQIAKRPAHLALVHFLDFLRSLPEKQIWADGGAEHRDHHQEIVGIDGGVRPDRGQQRLAPGDVHGKGGRDIGEQRERHEFEHRRISPIRHEHLQQGGGRRENQRMFVIEPADHQRQRFPHRGDVGRDVERVGGDQQENQRQHQPARRELHHIGGKPLAGDAADPRAHQLDRDHEWRGEKHGPQQAVAKLRAGLRVGRNARRIVVGGAGHQSRTQQPKHHVAGFFGLCVFGVGHESLRGPGQVESVRSLPENIRHFAPAIKQIASGPDGGCGGSRTPRRPAA